MDILLHDKTLTSQFLMPLLFENHKFNEIISDFKSFVGAYIADFDKPNYDNKIILIFKTKQKDLPSTNQVDHYTKTIKDGELYAYVYEIPEDLADNYTAWLMGRYSLFSDKAKEMILNFWSAGKDTLIYGVLYKTGVKIKKYYKEHFNTDLDEKWSNEDKDWWIEPLLAEEIYGAE
jgi:hypothetical protein